MAPLQPYASFGELQRFMAAFESATLPRAEWTHRAHLTMAAWYLANHPQPQATQLIRDGIHKLNRAHGTVSGADHGYHETITLFYAGAVAHHLRSMNGSASLVNAVNTLLAARGHKELPFEYYSRERLMSREARARWLEPDLKPIEWSVNDPSRVA